jgi:hypothetical protein
MGTLGGTILMLMVSIFLGKHTKRFRVGTYAMIILLAVIEVIIVLYEMYTMPMPKI